MIVRLGYRNVQRKMPKVHGILRHRPDVLGLGEPFVIVRRLRDVARYRTLSGKTLGERDTAVMVKRGRVKVVRWYTVKLSDAVDGHEGVAHARYATVVWYRVRTLRGWSDLLVHVNFHLTPLRANKGVIRAHNEGAAALLDLVERLLETDLPLTLTGDTNRQSGRGVHAELERLLVTISSGVDVVGWSHDLELDARNVRRRGRKRWDNAWSYIFSDDHNGVLARVRKSR